MCQAFEGDPAWRQLGYSSKREFLEAAERISFESRGLPYRCCGEWPECSHTLDALKEREERDA